ncbi:MAG: hypothetical protein ACE5Q6_16910, partial [Dehalococcoidia bacterium]
MNAPNAPTKINLQMAHQEIKKNKEQIQMWMKKEMEQVKNWTAKGLSSGHFLKILGVVVVSALVIGVSGLQNTLILGDEPKNTTRESTLIPSAPSALVGFTPNQQVEIL